MTRRDIVGSGQGELTMRVLVIGAYGLIGSAILAALHRAGHELVGAGRSIASARRRFPYAQWVAADFHRLTTADAWAPLLAGIDAVVNCVGAFQTSARDDLRRIHVAAPLALFAACERAGIRRVIHVSAIGAGRDGPTEFATTKGESDARLAASDLGWLILRPGVVLSPGVYGASAMLRGLAGLPWRTPLIAAESAVQIVSVDDIADTVVWALGPGAALRAILDVVYPDPYTLGHLVAEQRRWLGFPPQPVWNLPPSLARLIAAVADGLGHLGWRSPARSTAVAQLAAAPTGDPAAWMTATGIRPKGLEEIFAAHPSTLQDRWFARLYALKPAAIACLSALFIVTGVISLGPGWSQGMALLAPAGLSDRTAAAVIIGGSLLDVALGIGLLVRRTARITLLAMLALTVLYLVIATILDPHLWTDPLGRLTKTIPVMLLMLFTLAVLDER
jgi:uncharacterized protein YbjT (DUF2867 family)